jgi:FixJ family two-component response regulator
MPEMSGLELQQELQQRKIQTPVIILTGHADVALAVRAMKAGAMDVIEKPFHDQNLLDSVSKALATSAKMQDRRRRQSQFLERASMLSPREQEIMNMYIDGKCGKAIAADLKISPKTVNVHRGHILEKMKVRTMIELVHLAMPSKV